jgi:hypothetical protein
MRLHCPNVVAAATKLAEAQKEAGGRCLWALGDALIKDCGHEEEGSCQISGMRTKAHNGSKATLETAVGELEARGINYEANTLRQIRDIAITFKKADRIEGLGFWAHGEAGNPTILQWIMRTVPKREKDRWGVISVVVIREKARQYREFMQRKERERHEAAKAKVTAAQEKFSRAKDFTDKQAAKEEVRAAKEEVVATKVPPLRYLAPPTKEQEGGLKKMVKDIQVTGHIQDAIRLIHQARKGLEVLDLEEQDLKDHLLGCDEIQQALDELRAFIKGEKKVHHLKIVS